RRAKGQALDTDAQALQWGRLPKEAERNRIGAICRPSTKLQWGRLPKEAESQKARAQAVRGRQASMGPPPEGGGEPRAASRPGAPWTLQWGRLPKEAESSAGRSTPPPRRWLQWGRLPKEAEREPGKEACDDATSNASMG